MWKDAGQYIITQRFDFSYFKTSYRIRYIEYMTYEYRYIEKPL